MQKFKFFIIFIIFFTANLSKAQFSQLEFRSKELQSGFEDYPQNDLKIISERITKRLVKWTTQGEFENSEMYQKRIQNLQNAFNRICYDEYIKRIDEIPVVYTLKNYHADEQYFDAELYFNNLSINVKQYVPIEKAREYKEKYLPDNLSFKPFLFQSKDGKKVFIYTASVEDEDSDYRIEMEDLSKNGFPINFDFRYLTNASNDLQRFFDAYSNLASSVSFSFDDYNKIIEKDNYYYNYINGYWVDVTNHKGYDFSEGTYSIAKEYKDNRFERGDFKILEGYLNLYFDNDNKNIYKPYKIKTLTSEKMVLEYNTKDERVVELNLVKESRY